MRTRIVDPLFEMLKGFPRQLRDHAGWYGAVLGVLAVMTAVMVHLHRNTHILVTELFEDPVEFGTLPLHVGIYTYLGGSTMIVAGSIMLFSAWSALDVVKDMRLFVGLLGFLLLWFGLDDVFMIHEYVGLRLAWLLEREDVVRDRQWLEAPVFAAYAIAWITLVVVFLRQVVRTAWILIVLTFACFGLSVVLDLYGFLDFLPNPTSHNSRLALTVGEDLAKLAGSFFGLAYAVQVSRQIVRARSHPL